MKISELDPSYLAYAYADPIATVGAGTDSSGSSIFRLAAKEGTEGAGVIFEVDFVTSLVLGLSC